MTISTHPAWRTPRVRVTLALGLLLVLIPACGDSEPETTPPPLGEMSAGKAPAPPAAQPAERGPSQAKAGEEGSVGSGEGALPEGFPEDLPLYPDATPTRWVVAGGSGSVAAFEVESDPQAVYEFFTSELPGAGWEIESQSASAAYWALVANKSGRKARISIVPTSGGTEIGVAVVAGN